MQIDKLTFGEKKTLEKMSGANLVAISRALRAFGGDDTVPLEGLPPIAPIFIALGVITGKRKYGPQNWSIADVEKLNDDELFELLNDGENESITPSDEEVIE